MSRCFGSRRGKGSPRFIQRALLLVFIWPGCNAQPGPHSISINTGDNVSCTAANQRSRKRATTIEDACDVGAAELGTAGEALFFVILTPDGKTAIIELQCQKGKQDQSNLGAGLFRLSLLGGDNKGGNDMNEYR